MPNTRPETAPKSRSGTPIRVSWAGNPWSLTGLCILNIILIVLTLGIYWFWARSEYRRRMWQMVRVNGEPLEYTGTGGELIVGYLKLFVFVMLPVIATGVAAGMFLGPEKSADRGFDVRPLYRLFLSLSCRDIPGKPLYPDAHPLARNCVRSRQGRDRLRLAVDLVRLCSRG